MFERGIVRGDVAEEFANRFERAKSYWSKRYDKGEVEDPIFFQEVFESPESEIYKERCDDDFFMYVAKVLGGIERKLPASSTSTSSSTAGEAPPNS